MSRSFIYQFERDSVIDSLFPGINSIGVPRRRPIGSSRLWSVVRKYPYREGLRTTWPCELKNISPCGLSASTIQY